MPGLVADPNAATTAQQLLADGATALFNTTFTFNPDANFNGIANFNYSITDGTATVSNTVALNVAAVNDAPAAFSGANHH